MRTAVAVVSLSIALTATVALLDRRSPPPPAPTSLRDELVRRGATARDLADYDFAVDALRALARDGSDDAMRMLLNVGALTARDLNIASVRRLGQCEQPETVRRRVLEDPTARALYVEACGAELLARAGL
ncbi:MAG: hypothetical protein FJ027_20145 [Candidatus Rokubacteria bacterium]|nr:hypothetical protein [Candidatus Rokubacteria bacterium]